MSPLVSFACGYRSLAVTIPSKAGSRIDLASKAFVSHCPESCNVHTQHSGSLLPAGHALVSWMLLVKQCLTYLFSLATFKAPQTCSLIVSRMDDRLLSATRLLSYSPPASYLLLSMHA